MKKDELITMSLLSSALSIFVDEPVLHVEGGSGEEEGEYAFLTYSRTGEPKEGFIEHNFLGNYNIWLEGKLAYEVEGELFDLLNEKRKGLISFYSKLKKINYEKLKSKSQMFVGIVLDQAENLIANPLVSVESRKEVKIKNNFIFSDRMGNKFVINLN